MAYTYQWERCAADGTGCSDLSGATGSTYLLVAADVGSTVRVRVSDGTTTVTSAQSGVIASAPAGGSYDTVVPALTYPAVTVARHIICTTRGQHDTAISNLQGGDWVDCQGITFTGQVNYNKALSAYAKVTYDGACAFTGVGLPGSPSPGNVTPAIYLATSSFLQLIFNGCPVTNAGGTGIMMHGGSHVVLDGFLVHNCGANGLSLFPASDGGPISGGFFRGEVYNIGLTHGFDPHAEKGTGLHCMNVADTGTYPFHDNIVAIYGHDCTFSGGSVIEMGDSSVAAYNNTLYVKAANMLFQATSQTGGNGVNLWGVTTAHDNDFKIVEATNMMGRAIDCQGVNSGNFTNVKVDRGRAHLCCQNPNLGSLEGSTTPWDTRHGVIYSADVLNV